jgi:hypothetical protein
MSFRNRLRSFERAWLRPLGRRLRLPHLGLRPGRMTALEARVAELESLTRELTGLVYLQLGEDPRPAAAAAEAREAA